MCCLFGVVLCGSGCCVSVVHVCVCIVMLWGVLCGVVVCVIVALL